LVCDGTVITSVLETALPPSIWHGGGRAADVTHGGAGAHGKRGLR